MIWKVLKSNIKLTQFAGVFLGIMLGITILMGAISFYLDVKPIFDDKQGFWKDEYIIINKQITLANTFSQAFLNKSGKPLFSDNEIEEIKKLPNVKQVARFRNCSFEISIYTDEKSILSGFYTDLFFESVPDEFIDVNYDDWKWDENSGFIPVVIPKTYLNLYNFGFAQSQNLPQISEETVNAVKFNVIIRGRGETRQFETRIVGFSERINTILAPEDFVKWGNQNFGNEKDPEPGRLIIIASDPSNSEMFKFFEEKNYEVNKSELNNSKALAFLKIIISIVFIIGFIIILLAFSLMIMSVQLLLQRNNENIRKLSILGYSLKEIAKPYEILVAVLFSVTFLCSLIPFFIFKNYYTSGLEVLGYFDFISTLFYIILPGSIFIVIVVCFLIILINRQVRKIIN